MKTAHYTIEGEIKRGEVTSMMHDILKLNHPIDETDELEHIVIHINSPGGDLVEALAAINLLQASNIPVTTVVNVEAASAALLILAAGDRRIAIGNSIGMAHHMSTDAGGNFHDIKTTVKSLEMIETSMIKFFSEVTGMNEMFIKRSFLGATDFLMTSEDMLRYGVVDLVVEPKELMETLSDYEKIEKRNGLKVQKQARRASRGRPKKEKS